MTKNEKYVIGMIVKSGHRYGVIDGVDTYELEGEYASVVWADGSGNAWYNLNELEIVENPIERYRQAYQNTKAIFTDENGNIRSCAFNERDMTNTAEAFLTDLGALNIDWIGDLIFNMLNSEQLECKCYYYINEQDYMNKINEHILTLTFQVKK